MMNTKELIALIELFQREGITFEEAKFSLLYKRKAQPINLDNFILRMDHDLSITDLLLLGFYDEPSILSYGLKGGYYPNKTQTNSPAPSLINGRLFSFDGTILSDSDRIAVMAEVGYRPAYLVELLTLGWQYPTLQYSYTICALGTEYRPYDTRSGSWPLYPYLMARKAFILDPRPWPSQDKEKNLYLAILVDEGK